MEAKKSLLVSVIVICCGIVLKTKDYASAILERIFSQTKTAINRDKVWKQKSMYVKIQFH